MPSATHFLIRACAATLFAMPVLLPAPVLARAPTAAPAALELRFDYEMARQVSRALRNGGLDARTAPAVLALPAAAGMIKKMHFKDGDALAAHFQAMAKDPAAVAAAALVADELEKKDGGKYALLADEVTRQLRQYVPPAFAARLKVYFIFGSYSDGFAFGDDPYNVYVNLARFSTATVQELAETVAHELFHAVQIGSMGSPPGSIAPPPAQAGNVWLNRLMYDLFQEGTAELFSHALANRPETPHSRRAYRRIARNAGRMAGIVDLFETAALRLALAPPANEDGYDRVYGLMFYTEFDETAYDLGWVMATAIEKKDGKPAIAALFKAPPKRFVLRYQEIALADATLPRFGDAFIRMVGALPD